MSETPEATVETCMFEVALAVGSGQSIMIDAAYYRRETAVGRRSWITFKNAEHKALMDIPEDGVRWIKVIPTPDEPLPEPLREHVTDASGKCWCDPKIIEVPGA